jgi:GDPmannose 4,6-dehydratase
VLWKKSFNSLSNVRALVTGAAGQDGIILSSMLSAQGASIVGLVKPGSDYSLLEKYAPNVTVIDCDLADLDRLVEIVRMVSPTHLWNFGGFTSVGDSWNNEDEVFSINVESVRALIAGALSVASNVRFFQASSAAIFEGTDKSPQTVDFFPQPKSPYARSKAAAMDIVRKARLESGLFACSGILYNHESPLRGTNFVTRKVSMAAARIAVGLQDFLELGDIEVSRDWGWAPDYVHATILMLQAPQPKDYLLATGISHRLSFFIRKAFLAAGITNWQDYVISTAANNRPADTSLLVGDSKAAYHDLGWRHSIDFDSMARIMVQQDMALLADPSTLWTILP